jgi:tetrahydromethanopterin:alpha-L-glutamate ligase
MAARPGAAPHVAIFAEPADRPAKAIAAELEARGAHARIVSLKACNMDSRAGAGLAIPGFEARLPDGAMVRNLPTGTFEQVTLRLGVLHALRERGVMVWNDARALEACVDKSMTTHLIEKAGLATPPTRTAQSRAEAAEIVAAECAEGAALVLKPLFGAQGRGLRLIHSVNDLPPEEEVAGAYYLQRFIEPAGEHWQDFRLFVVGGSVIAGMSRIGQTWITNVKQGALPQATVLTRELAGTAERAARAVGADYAGVDLIRGRCGTLFTLEVNSMPAWSGLEEANPGLSVASILAAQFLDALGERGRAVRAAGGGP